MRANLLPRLYVVLAMTLAAVTIGLTAASRPAEALTNCSVSDLSVDTQEAQFLQLINAYRPSSAPDLTISINLNRAASWMARDLATRSDGVFSHTDSLGRSASTRGSQCDGTGGFGENIAAGTVRDTAQEAFDAWKASSGHNTNMLNSSYRQIGIARYYNADSYYKWYWVTIFSTSNDGTLINPGASTPTPSPTSSPTPTPPPPTPSPTPSPTPPPAQTCTAPVITSDYDTDPTGAGTVTINWSAVPGATAYRVMYRQGTNWISRGAYASTSYTGLDAADDPLWRIYVSAGTCSPVPGAVTYFDPDGMPPGACSAPAITNATDTDPTGGGTVTISWQPIAGATSYRILHRQGTSWVSRGTYTATSYTGADGADDPQWRVYVASGTCTPIPGPQTYVDPN